MNKLRLTFITPCVVETFFAQVRRGADEAAAALGVEYTFTGTTEVDIPEQVALVRRAIAERYDGIALSICHATAFNEAVSEALAAGIPVVAFNIDDRSGGNARLAGISQDFIAAGRGLARKVLEHVGRGATILITKHSEGVAALEQRVAGLCEVFGSAGIATEVAVSGMFASQAEAVVAAALKRATFGAVVATGQADTEGAAKAMAALPPQRRVPVAGFDLSDDILRLIRDGIVLCTVDQQPYLQGFYPIVQLTHHVRLGLAPSDIDAGAAIVSRENVAQVMHWCAQGYR